MNITFNEHFVEPKIIGNGNFGTVYQVNYKIDNQLYAIKKIPLNDVMLEKELTKDDVLRLINQEVEMLMKIAKNGNKYVVQYYHHWCESSLKKDKVSNDVYYIQMELCSQSLDDVIQAINSLRNEKSNDILKDRQSYIYDIKIVINFLCGQLFRETVECVNYLHKSEPKIIHRDLKPQNILVVGNVVNNRFLKLCDFNMSKAHEWSTMSNTSRVGTFKYTAPEVLNGHKYNTMADIYSLSFIAQDLFQVDIYGSEEGTDPMACLKKLLAQMIDHFFEDRPKCSEILVRQNEWLINEETVKCLTFIKLIKDKLLNENNRFLYQYLLHHLSKQSQH
ncbi:interferon-induced, double-stranded RNA-activated protein kinase-like [Oppia nitens]|uniref:interferon-induced, double-stranded RNA-activated protein kinase-like n=1 Tax=Oppia nitens TaxID=1686743 RepID=UPI0023DACB2B|nr:interferon-induced, double-stranded RNA-activated protein kinase-like [Oppia nitens]